MIDVKVTADTGTWTEERKSQFNRTMVLSTFGSTKSLDRTADLLEIAPEQVYWVVKIPYKLVPVRTYEDRETVRDGYKRAVSEGAVGLLADRIDRSVKWVNEQAISMGLAGEGLALHKNRIGKFARFASSPDARSWLVKLRDSKLGLGKFAEQQGVQAGHLSRYLAHYFPEEYSSLLARRSARAKSKVVGSRFEKQVADLLRGMGYHIVLPHRSWGAVDVYGFRPLTDLTGASKVLFVQCKYDFKISIAERNNLLEVARAAGAYPLVAGQRGGAIEFTLLVAPRVEGNGPLFEVYEP